MIEKRNPKSLPVRSALVNILKNIAVRADENPKKTRREVYCTFSSPTPRGGEENIIYCLLILNALKVDQIRIQVGKKDRF